MKMFDLKFHHISLTIPVGAEDIGRQFYCGILGFKEIEKPDSLKANGGFWVETGNLPLHIGVEKQSEQITSKRHPAFETNNLEEVRNHLLKHGVKLKDATAIPCYERFYAHDPFGNRIEFISRRLPFDD